MAKSPSKVTTPYYQPPASQPPARVPVAPGKAAVPTAATGGQKPLRSTSQRMFYQARNTFKGQFVVVASGCMLFAIVLAIFLSLSFQRASDDLNTIAYGSIPSVNAAQALAQYIDDIDAKSADYLATATLHNTIACTVPVANSGTLAMGQETTHTCDQQTIDAEINLANHQLFEAAHNVTYPGERTAVERITEGMEEYSSQMTVMMHEFDLATNKGDPNDPHMQLAYQAYLDASSVLHNRIVRQPARNAQGQIVFDESASCTINNQVLPINQWALGSLDTNITCLSQINKNYLDSAYNDTSGFVGYTIALAILLCLVFCGLLVFTTVRMVFVTHRVIHPALMLALLMAIILSIASTGLFTSLGGRHGVYGQMVKDDYLSVYDAALLQRYGTNANADESRWLIALEFNRQDEVTRWANDWQTNTQQVSNYIAMAQQNQTWPQEIQPLADMHTYWGKYYTIDGQIRSMANNVADPNRIQDAEVISTGRSNDAFGSFSDAVHRLSQANDYHYKLTLSATTGLLMTYILWSAVLSSIAGLLAVWGISRRLKDF